MDEYTITREQVTWIRWDKQAMRNRISHPWQYVVEDNEGNVLFFGDTKAEAKEWVRNHK